MMEVINQLINLVVQFISWFFTLYIDFDGTKMSVGNLALILLFILAIIFCIIYAFRLRGDDN